MKLSDVYSVYEFCRTYIDSALPARASFAIAKFLNDGENSVALLSQKKEELIRKYAKEVSDNPDKPGYIDFKMEEDSYRVFDKELNDLLNTEIDIHFQLHYEDLESLPLTPREVAKILPYVE